MHWVDNMTTEETAIDSDSSSASGSSVEVDALELMLDISDRMETIEAMLSDIYAHLGLASMSPIDEMEDESESDDSSEEGEDDNEG